MFNAAERETPHWLGSGVTGPSRRWSNIRSRAGEVEERMFGIDSKGDFVCYGWEPPCIYAPLMSMEERTALNIAAIEITKRMIANCAVAEYFSPSPYPYHDCM